MKPNIVDIGKQHRAKLQGGATINQKAPKANFQDNCLAEALSHDNMFTPEECVDILALADGKWEDAKVGKSMSSGDDTTVRSGVRNNQNYILTPGEDTFELFNKLLQVVMAANNAHYRFDINHFNAVQISKYEVGEYYHDHMDIGPGVMGNRKISLTLQLSDPDSYEGGDLILDFIDFHASRELGSVTLFPSFLTHRVRPVTKGTRYSLVAWISGEHRFK